MTKIFLAVAFLLSLSVSAAAQQADTRISIMASGAERGTFIPRPAPYVEGGPAVSVYLYDRRNVRTTDGLIITGFEFIGWSEGDATRVMVFALVPRADAPNVYLPEGKYELLQRRQFATYLIAAEQGIPVSDMRDLAIEPMVLVSRSIERGSPRGRLEQAARALDASRSRTRSTSKS
jgi:hypothetical protein